MEIHCINKTTLFNDLKLNYCGYHECSPNFAYGPHTRDCHLIHYIINGEGVLNVGGKEHVVRAGEIFAVSPGEVVSYRASSGNPWTYCWFAFEGSVAGEIISHIGINRINPVKRVVLENKIPEQVNDLICLMQSENPNQLRILGILYSLLAWLDETESDGTGIDGTESDGTQKDLRIADHIKKAVQYIGYNYFKPLTIQGLADYVCLERSYFSKLFHKHTGMSPQDFLSKYRIEKSISLMKTTGLNIKQISSCVGIEETYYSRQFRKAMGISPKKYREALRADP